MDKIYVTLHEAKNIVAVLGMIRTAIKKQDCEIKRMADYIDDIVELLQQAKLREVKDG